MSNFGKITWKEFFIGLIYAFVTPVFTGAIVYLDNGVFPTDWKSLLIPGVSAMLVYLLKTMATNNNGQLFTKDQK